MRRAEFLAAVNARAAELGLAPINPRMLSDWVDEGLVPGPDRLTGQGGAGWTWSRASLEAAFQVLDLKRRGFRRTGELKAQIWIETDRLDLSDANEALIDEHYRASRLLTRGIRSALLDSSNSGDYQILSLLRQIGNASCYFGAAGIQLPRDALIALIEYASNGYSIAPESAWIRELEHITRALSMSFNLSSLNGVLPLSADPHGRAGAEAIRSLGLETLDFCRLLVRAMPHLVQLFLLLVYFTGPQGNRPAIDRLSAALERSLERPPWSVGLFGTFAIILHNSEVNVSKISSWLAKLGLSFDSRRMFTGNGGLGMARAE